MTAPFPRKRGVQTTPGRQDVSGRRSTLPGVLDDALLADWCLRYLGLPLNRVL
jgi:hypothetical protein